MLKIKLNEYANDPYFYSLGLLQNFLQFFLKKWKMSWFFSPDIFINNLKVSSSLTQWPNIFILYAVTQQSHNSQSTWKAPPTFIGLW